MRPRRIKAPAEEWEADYHGWTRAVNREYLFCDDGVKAKFVELMWKVADYSGLTILTYAMLCTHGHIATRVPLKVPISDAELLRRYAILHPPSNPRHARKIEVIRALLAEGRPEGEKWRQAQLRQMGDLSEFWKILKQMFSVWYNEKYGRVGTLWAERFGSELLEGKVDLTGTVGVYIDLNPVRAGLVADPKDYRHCGYGAAVRGDVRAQRGIMAIVGKATWEEAQAEYRLRLFAVGAGPRENAQVIPREELERVIAAKGKLPLATALLYQAPYLTKGLVLGSREFVAKQLARYREKVGPLPRAKLWPLPSYTDWGEVVAMRRPREKPPA